MGREIDHAQFGAEDFEAFRDRLRTETEQLREWIRGGQLADTEPTMGLELEAWLVDGEARPAPWNDRVIQTCDDPHVENELGQYNLELNTAVHPLRGDGLARLRAELEDRWARIQAAAGAHDARAALIGILPTVRESDLTLEQMTPSPRYAALNHQILALRNREPMRLDIAGADPLTLEHPDVMLEAATTSLQLHLQVEPDRVTDAFNASVAASAATVAVAANSPLLFGHRLWEETRIPLFEQAVAVTPPEAGRSGPLSRVGFGSGYGRDGLYGFFVENRQHHPVLLPVLMDDPPEALSHLRLHNGTVWRWNRPLVENTPSGCHLRIEHRVMAAGPTIADALANAAFYYGLCRGLMNRRPPVVESLAFHEAEQNFYRAARSGLSAEVGWFDGARGRLDGLILNELLPLAHAGLQDLDVDRVEARAALQIIEERVRSGRTGAAWQRQWRARHGADDAGLVQAWLERAAAGDPVHRWAA